MGVLECVPIPPLEDPLRLSLPGGIAIEHQNLAELAQSALAPLAPVFTIIETIVAIAQAIEAIPAALGPPPDPSKITSAIDELKKKMEKLILLIPQTSLPVTLIGLVDILLSELKKHRLDLLALAAQVSEIENSRKTAQELGDEVLMAIADCAEKNIEQEADNLARAIAALSGLVTIVGLFSKMVGGPEMPDFASVRGKALSELLAPIEALITALETIRGVIPGG